VVQLVQSVREPHSIVIGQIDSGIVVRRLDAALLLLASAALPCFPWFLMHDGLVLKLRYLELGYLE
jgi:uncharacterized protein YgbK (DUF1537 family)